MQQCMYVLHPVQTVQVTAGVSVNPRQALCVTCDCSGERSELIRTAHIEPHKCSKKLCKSFSGLPSGGKKGR